MLYILGGAARSGKSMLAKRIVREKQIPYFRTDHLIGVLSASAPEHDIHHGHPFIDKSKKLWKFTKSLFNILLDQEENYLVEGDAILPEQVAEMIKNHPKDVKACFVGYTSISSEEKLKIIRTFTQKIDWTKNHDDKYMLETVKGVISYSKYIKEECEKYGLKYFDISHDFEKTHDEIYRYLFN